MELSTYCLNFVCDFLVFVLVESFTRQVFPGKGCPKITLLLSQLVFLLMLCVVTFLHHVPYLLSLIVIGVLARICFISVSSLQPTKNEFVSKPLQNAAVKANNVHMPSQSYYPSLPQTTVLSQHKPEYRLHPQHYSSGRTTPNPVHTQASLANSTLNRRSLTGSPPISLPAKSAHSLLGTVSQAAHFPSLPKLPALKNYIGSMFDFKQSTNSCPPGLLNSGNTCFVNSILQCLIWTPGFVYSLTQTDFGGSENEAVMSELTKVMLTMFQFQSEREHHRFVNVSDLLMWMSSLAPHLFVNRDGLSFQSQQDSAEFLLWLLNFIHTEVGEKTELPSRENMAVYEDAKRICVAELSQMKSTDANVNSKLLMYSDVEWSLHTMKTKSLVYGHFLGQLLEARECQLCGKLSLNIEYFMVLPLPLLTSAHTRQVFTLNDCFRLFSEIEELVHSNMITCSCIVPTEQSLIPGQRRSLISKAPKNLIIQLSRYSYKTSLQTTVKNKVCIQFETSFRLPLTIQSELGSSSQESVTYRLVGVCVHTGAENTSYGHYVAYCQTPVGWCYFNDDTVERVSDIEEELKGYFILQNAYILFYAQVC